MWLLFRTLWKQQGPLLTLLRVDIITIVRMKITKDPFQYRVCLKVETQMGAFCFCRHREDASRRHEPVHLPCVCCGAVTTHHL